MASFSIWRQRAHGVGASGSRAARNTPTIVSPSARLLAICLLLLMALLPLRSRAETATSIDIKLLVISADGTEPVFAGIQATLKQIGIPFETLIATQASTPFSASTLSNGQGAGRYQGIILTTG
ncbi:MAG: hypothetical protein ACRYGK_14910, partial [Janthinobacterium lividum]